MIMEVDLCFNYLLINILIICVAFVSTAFVTLLPLCNS